MLILRKRFSNPSDIYEELKTVLGSRDIIISSMEQYLMSINRTLDSLNGNGIVLCDSITGTTSDTTDLNNIHKYNDTFSHSIEAESVKELVLGNNIDKPCTNTAISDTDYSKAYCNYPSTSLPNYAISSDIAINKSYINTKYNFDNYNQFVKWTLYVIDNNYPSPFSLGYPNAMYTLHLNKDNFLITFPNGIGFGIHVVVREGRIFFDADIVYNGSFSDQILFKQINVYKSAIDNGWECK